MNSAECTAAVYISGTQCHLVASDVTCGQNPYLTDSSTEIWTQYTSSMANGKQFFDLIMYKCRVVSPKIPVPMDAD